MIFSQLPHIHRIFKQLAKALSLCWSHIPHCWKSHVIAKLAMTGEIKNAKILGLVYKGKHGCPNISNLPLTWVVIGE